MNIGIFSFFIGAGGAVRTGGGGVGRGGSGVGEPDLDKLRVVHGADEKAAVATTQPKGGGGITMTR
jgi:hypothetical protein